MKARNIKRRQETGKNYRFVYDSPRLRRVPPDRGDARRAEGSAFLPGELFIDKILLDRFINYTNLYIIIRLNVTILASKRLESFYWGMSTMKRNCIFCDPDKIKSQLRDKTPCKSDFYEDEKTFAILAPEQYTTGHALLILKNHKTDITYNLYDG